MKNISKTILILLFVFASKIANAQKTDNNILQLEKVKNNQNIQAKPQKKAIQTKSNNIAKPLENSAKTNEIAKTAEVSDKKETTKLPQITITDSVEKEEGGYQDRGTRVTRGGFLTATKDIPQALTIVNRNLMDDRNAFSLRDALRNAGGITFDMMGTERNRSGDRFNIRGFEASGDLYLDGVRDFAQYNRDTFNTETVEVLRGSSSMLFGRSSVGGLVNQVSKEPELNSKSKLTLTGGTQSFSRGTVDFNNKIGENSAVRINLMKQDNESHRNIVENDSVGFAPSIKFGINTDNELLLSYYRLQYNRTPDFGIPTGNSENGKPISVPNDNFYGSANDFQKDRIEIYTIKSVNKIDKNNIITTIFRKSDSNYDIFASRPRYSNNFANSNPIVREITGRGASERNFYAQTNYNSRFELFNLKHETLAGVDFQRESVNGWFYDASQTFTRVDDLYPDAYKNYGGIISKGNPFSSTYKNLAFFAQDIIELTPKYKVLVGLRHDRFETKYEDRVENSNPKDVKYETSDGEFSYRGAFMYQPDKNSNYYIQRASSFSPTGEFSQDINTRSVNRFSKSEETINTEIGAKWELFDSALSLRTAAFNTKRRRERNRIAGNGISLAGERHVNGFELEAAGSVTKKLEIYSSITLMKSRIDNHNNNDISGFQDRNVPSISGNIWTTYKFLPKLKAGIGADFIGKRVGYDIPTSSTASVAVKRIPGFVTFDAMIGWYEKNYSLKLNAINLLDKEHFDQLLPNGSLATPGSARALQATFTYNF